MSQKDLYLVRGLPGAGKTVFSHSIAQDSDAVVSADDFMVDSAGTYAFDGNRLDEVHDSCAKKVFEAMEKGTPRIFVHNTFTEKWELERYITLARQHGYRVFSIIIENRHEHSSTHGTPEETIAAMRQRFEIEL